MTSVYVQFEGRLDADFAKDLASPEDRMGRSPMPDQTAEFCFWDERPVIPTLNFLAVQVAQVLVSFQSDFGESDQLTIRDEQP